MKKEEFLHKASDAHANALGPVVICSACAEELKRKQQEHEIVLKVGKEQIKIVCRRLLRITVEKNDCYLFVRKAGTLNGVIRYSFHCTLLNWKYLEDFGLVQVTPSCILNLAHVERVVKNELFSKYLDEGIEVTKKHMQRVAELLPYWSGLQLLSVKRED